MICKKLPKILAFQNCSSCAFVIFLHVQYGAEKVRIPLCSKPEATRLLEIIKGCEPQAISPVEYQAFRQKIAACQLPEREPKPLTKNRLLRTHPVPQPELASKFRREL